MLDIADLHRSSAAPKFGELRSASCPVGQGQARRPSAATHGPVGLRLGRRGPRGIRRAGPPRLRLPGPPGGVGDGARRPLSPRALDEASPPTATLSGLPPELDLHCLRHSYITHLIEDGFPERFVTEQAGHSWGSTTGIYTSVSDDFKNRIWPRPSPAPSADPSRETGHDPQDGRPLAPAGGDGRQGHVHDHRPGTPLVERGIDLSREQVYRLVTQQPERLNVYVLAALCDIFGARRTTCWSRSSRTPAATRRPWRREPGPMCATFDPPGPGSCPSVVPSPPASACPQGHALGTPFTRAPGAGYAGRNSPLHRGQPAHRRSSLPRGRGCPPARRPGRGLGLGTQSVAARGSPSIPTSSAPVARTAPSPAPASSLNSPTIGIDVALPRCMDCQWSERCLTRVEAAGSVRSATRADIPRPAAMRAGEQDRRP